MKVAGLFAGIGSIEVGLNSAEHETELLSGSWTWPAVLAERFAGAVDPADVLLIDAVEPPAVATGHSTHAHGSLQRLERHRLLIEGAPSGLAATVRPVELARSGR
jgi:hypothetical protein